MPKRILIADDNEVVRGRLGELLESQDGWEVCAAVANGRDAIQKAVELKPSLIILDMAMPQMDGLSTAREISKILPSIPIVLFTLHKFPTIELEAMKAGVRHVVAKPDAGILLRVVAEELLKDSLPDSNHGHVDLLASASGPLDDAASARITEPGPDATQVNEANSDNSTSN
jgi:CheY-like chemotaxis protein